MLNFTYNTNRAIGTVLITVAIGVLAANTYNSFADTGRFDVNSILGSSITSITTIVSAFMAMRAQWIDPNGDKLKEKEDVKDGVAK